MALGQGAHPRPTKVHPALDGQRSGRQHRPLRYWRCWTKSESGFGLATAARFSRNCAGTASSQRLPLRRTLATRTCRFNGKWLGTAVRHRLPPVPFSYRRQLADHPNCLHGFLQQQEHFRSLALALLSYRQEPKRHFSPLTHIPLMAHHD